MWEQASISQFFSPPTEKKNTNDTSADEDIYIPEADAITKNQVQDK